MSTKNSFLKLAAERYSCRGFQSKPVSDEDIAAILEAARLAPTAVNRQPVHIWVMKSPEARAKLKEATPYTFDAPVVFLVGCKKDEAWVRKYDGHNGAEIDVQTLLDAGVLSKCRYGFKVLGHGELTKALTVKAAAFSEGAKAKIEAAGGKAEVV